MKIVEVTTKDQEKQFLALPFEIYKNDPNWIPHLKQDIIKVFSRKHNIIYKHGEAIRWILFDDNNRLIGRIAAFINHKLVEVMEHPVGGTGFFECINDQVAANMLLDTAANWLKGKGMKGMDAPVNFGERDRFWGLLVEGFTPPSYMEPYNPPYYQELFENYGFQKYFEQTTYKIVSKEYTLGRFEKIAKWVMRKPEYEFRHLELNKLEKYAEDFVHVYNNAWKKFENFKAVSKQDILNSFKAMKPVILPEFVFFCYVNKEPAGVFILIPEVNQLFRHVKGDLNLFGKLKFLYYKSTTKVDTLRGMVFGVHPKYQNLGLDAAMSYMLYNGVQKKPQFKYIGISWIGGFNTKMQSLIEALNGRLHKIHYTYRMYFDKSIEFKPYSLKEDDENK